MQLVRGARTAWTSSSVSMKLLAIVALAFVLRAGVAVWMPQAVVWHDDGERYEKVADNLLEGRGFGSFEDNLRSVPAQPVLIAAVKLVFGKDYRALRVAAAVLGTIVCVAAFFITRRLFNAEVALLAAGLIAVYPMYVYLFALFEYPQPLFIAVMGLFYLAYYNHMDRNSGAWALAAGLCLGVAMLAVPTVLAFFLLLAGWMLLEPTLGRRRFAAAGLMAAGLFVVVAPWTVRNYVEYHRFILVNASGGIEFWKSNNVTYDRYGKYAVIYSCVPRYRDSVFCQDLLRIQTMKPDPTMNAVDRVLAKDKMHWQLGFAFIKEDPVRFLALTARKLIELWNPLPNPISQGTGTMTGIRDAVAFVSFAPLLLFAVYGVVLSARSWRKLVPLYLYVLSFSAVYSVFLPTTRYRLPVDFVMILFAAYGMWRMSRTEWAQRAGFAALARLRMGERARGGASAAA